MDVLETGYANTSHYWASATGVQTNADDGLGVGDPVTHPGGSVYGSTCTGSLLQRLTVPAGQLSVTLPQRILTASLSYATADPGGSGGRAVNYTVAVDSRDATISLPGTTPDANGNSHILIGQECQGTLAVTGFPTGTTITNLRWSATGNTVQSSSWNISSGNTSATFSGLVNPYTFTQATPQATGPSWYWDDSATSQTVTCTATMTPPSGQGAPVSVTATQKVTLDSPVYGKPGSSTGVIALDTRFQLDLNNLDLHAGGGADGGANGVPGVTFNDTVATPSLYSAKGYWYHVQLISVSRYQTLANQTTVVGMLGNGVKNALDASSTDPQGVTYIYGSKFAADGTAPSPVDNDCPSNGVEDSFQEYNIKGESFQDFVMYHPPGTGSIDVPLESFTWSWNVDVKSTGSPKSWNNWKNAPTNGTITPPSSPTRTLTYPTWSSLRNLTLASQ